MSMKLLTLPVCPHCGTKYGYKETSEMKSGVQNCYYCKKKFVPQKKQGRIIMLCTVCMIMIIFNLIIFYSSRGLSLSGFAILVASDAAAVTAAVLLFPLTVRLKPVKMTKSEKKSAKNIKVRNIRR